MSTARRLLTRTLVRRQPWTLRNGHVVFGVLRQLRPVLRIGRVVILTRHEDVRTVLERDDAFSVRYGARMEAVTGPFVLGWDDGDRYRAEIGALRAAAPAEDLPRVAALTREHAERAVAPGGGLDAVALADAVVGAGIEHWFGLPELSGPARREDARAVFRAVFLDGDEPDVLRAGKAASDRLVEDIRTAMSRSGADGDDVLARLVAQHALRPEAITRNMVGLLAAWAASVPRAFALALDALLDHPEEVRRAARAAAAGDEAAVAGHLLEALRLQPQASFVGRLCHSEVVLAPGSPREHGIRPGDVAIAVTQSAMRDKHVLDAPDALDPHRDPDELLHFGAGLHRCFGEGIARAQFGALGTALLRRGAVRRAGPLRWGAAYPAALPVTVSS